MRRLVSAIIACATLGVIPPLLVRWAPQRIGQYFFGACPACIASMALDHASQSTAAEVWAMIVAANAALYAVVGLLLFGLWAIRKSN